MSVVTEAQVEQWSQHPLVTTAARNLGGDYAAIDLLDELLGLMHGLEERFPLVPFRDILSCHDESSAADRQRVGLTLLDAGADQADVEALVGTVTGDEIGEPEFRLAYAEVSKEELMTKHGRSKTAADHIRQLRQPMTEMELMLLDMIEREPHVSKTEIARRAGSSMGTLRKATRKQRYRRWLERQAVLAS